MRISGSSANAIAFNTTESKLKTCLRVLRMRAIKTHEWLEEFPGSHFAKTIEVLRNAHGFKIDGDGSNDNPYDLFPRDQWPSLVAVKDGMKEVYWESQHWKALAKERAGWDDEQCVRCFGTEDLRCHHTEYHLFNEELWHLITVCEECHDAMHHACKLKFPSGMRVEHVIRLGFKPEFDEWLVPLSPEVRQSEMFRKEGGENDGMDPNPEGTGASARGRQARKDVRM